MSFELKVEDEIQSNRKHWESSTIRKKRIKKGFNYYENQYDSAILRWILSSLSDVKNIRPNKQQYKKNQILQFSQYVFVVIVPTSIWVCSEFSFNNDADDELFKFSS